MRRVGYAATAALLRAEVFSSCLSCVGTRRREAGRQIRPFGTTPGSYEPKGQAVARLGMDGFTDATYNAAADEFLERVENTLEAIGDPEALEDVNLAGGVLVIETARRGTFVLNKQAPNVQLWLSSPLSGPHHYDMTKTSGGCVDWQADTDGHSLEKKLQEELSEVLGTGINLSPAARGDE